MHFSVLIFTLVVIGYGMVTGAQGDSSVSRQKRAGQYLYTMGAAVLRSIKATKDLLDNSEPIAKDIYKSMYIKQGDLAQAVKDFNSFKPDTIYNFQPYAGPMGKWADVGDRTLLLTRTESGRPVLQIFKGLGTSSEHVDTITYMDKLF